MSLDATERFQVALDEFGSYCTGGTRSGDDTKGEFSRLEEFLGEADKIIASVFDLGDERKGTSDIEKLASEFFIIAKRLFLTPYRELMFKWLFKNLAKLQSDSSKQAFWDVQLVDSLFQLPLKFGWLMQKHLELLADERTLWAGVSPYVNAYGVAEAKQKLRDDINFVSKRLRAQALPPLVVDLKKVEQEINKWQ